MSRPLCYKSSLMFDVVRPFSMTERYRCVLTWAPRRRGSTAFRHLIRFEPARRRVLVNRDVSPLWPRPSSLLSATTTVDRDKRRVSLDSQRVMGIHYDSWSLSRAAWRTEICIRMLTIATKSDSDAVTHNKRYYRPPFHLH